MYQIEMVMLAAVLGGLAVCGSASADGSENARQAACYTELNQIKGAEDHEALLAKPFVELAKCPNSGLPVGTYKSDGTGSAAYVELEVTQAGCASYMVSNQRHAQFTKTFEDKNGTYQKDYTRFDLCVFGGVAQVSPLRAHNTGFDEGCSYVSVDDKTPWTVTKGVVPTVTMSVDPRVVVRRVSRTVALDHGWPRLWRRQWEHIGSGNASLDLAFRTDLVAINEYGPRPELSANNCEDLIEAKIRWHRNHPQN